MSERVTLTFDLHRKVDSDRTHAVVDCTGVQPIITNAHRFFAVNTGIGEGDCIRQARPCVRRTWFSHSRAVQLQRVSLYDSDCFWRQCRYDARLI